MEQFTIGDHGELIIRRDDEDWRLEVPAEVLPDLRGLVKFGKPGSTFTASSGTIFSIDEDCDLAVYGTGQSRWIKWQQFDRLVAVLDMAPRAEVAGTDRHWQYKVSGDDEYLYHASSTTYVFQLSSTGNEAKARELAQWFIQHQPAISETDRLYLTGHVRRALSAACVAKLAEIRAAIEAGTYSTHSPAYRWYIDESGDLNFNPSAGDEYVMDFDLAQHEGFSRIDAKNLAEWFVQHQPAITEDERLALTDQDRTDGGHDSERSARMLKAIKARVEAAEVVPDASALTSAAAQYDATCAEIGKAVPLIRWRTTTESSANGQPTLQLSTDGETWVAVYTIGYFSPGEFAPYAKLVADTAVARQPQISSEGMRLCISGSAYEAYTYLLHTTGFDASQYAAQDLADNMPLPFTPDRAEVSDDPAFWAMVGQTPPQPIRIGVYFTFDPADINTARQVYAALEHLPYDIRKAVKIS